MLEQSVADIVRKMEDEDQTGNTKISKYVSYSQRENIDKIDAYLNSKHVSGSTDSMGRDKPFFNIVTAATNIWYRATDIDRKNIKLKATKQSDYILTFIVSILLQEYMRKANFGVFLNEWGRVMSRYGSAVAKFIVKRGELVTEVLPWNRLIVDPVDFENNVKIEMLWFTPAQLRARKEYDQDKVEELIETKTVRETADGQKKDNKDDYIQLFEVHGELPLSYITDKEEDETTYSQQMHVISYLAKKTGKNEFDDYTLFRGKEAKDPSMITHLIKEDGRTMAIGAVENLFESQWMVNHNIKSIKDQLDLASKLIFQTSDGNFVGQNALTAIETGDILIHAQGQPITQANNQSHDISSLQAFGQQWEVLGNKINGIAESMVSQAKSGTAWRQTQAELQEAHSLFGLMIENKGLAIEEMMRKYIIPFLKTKMDNADEISAILDEYQINKLDAMFVPAEANKRVNNMIINDILNKSPEDVAQGNLFTPEQQQEAVANEQQAIQGALSQLGNQRFIKPSEIKGKTWKKALKDFEWDVEVDVTGENKDTNAILTTLTTVLQTVAGLQGQPMSPEMSLVFNRILEETGALSAVEIDSARNKQSIAPAPQPAEQPVGEELNNLTK